MSALANRSCPFLGARTLAPWLITLAPLVGCLASQVQTSKFSGMPELTGPESAGPDSVPAAAKASLPPKKAAMACVATAEELQAKGHANEAVLLFERARQLDPKQARVCRDLAVLYDQQGQDARALAEYQKALELTPRDADLLNDWGYFHFRRGDWTEAEKQFRAALAESPTHERATINLGLTLGEQGRYQDSYEVFAKAIGPAAAHSNVGVLLASRGRDAEARVAFQKALELQANLPQARAFLTHLNRSSNVAAR
jgi:Tfp pilus assembly protein PilF